jgi:hypothetical protein
MPRLQGGYVRKVTQSIIIAAWIGASGWLGAVTRAEAQVKSTVAAALAADSNPIPGTVTSYSQLLPVDRQEIADEERLTWSLKKFPSQKYMNEIYWQFPSDTPAFFRDSLAQFVSRSYYLTRDNFDGSKSQAWAAGGWLAFRSGLLWDTFGVQAAYYISQPLFAPDDESGTKLLNPQQDPLSMLGQLYGRMQIGDQELRGGMQLLDTPLINPQDNRMVPNTFDGTTVVTLPDKDRNYDYAFGYLWDVKQRDSNDFISMSAALAGSDIADRGATFGMVKYRPFSGFSTVFMDYFILDFVNTGFAQAEYDFQQPKNVPNWIVGANIIEQASIGSDLLTGSFFSTYQASAKVQMTYEGWTLFVAGSSTGDQSKIFSPFGTKPNYTDMQQVSFDNANEKAVGGSVAYDFSYAFSKYGFSGLSVGVWATHGWDAIDPITTVEIPDRDELDLWIQYRPTEGWLKGFRLKTQYSDVWQDDGVRNDQPELRFLIDYTVLFRPPLG